MGVCFNVFGERTLPFDINTININIIVVVVDVYIYIIEDISI